MSGALWTYTTKSGWNSAPLLSCTQWFGHMTCVPISGSSRASNTLAPSLLLANEMWSGHRVCSARTNRRGHNADGAAPSAAPHRSPEGCQSCVNTTISQDFLRSSLITGTVASPSGTASEPPEQKSFWTTRSNVNVVVVARTHPHRGANTAPTCTSMINRARLVLLCVNHRGCEPHIPFHTKLTIRTGASDSEAMVTTGVRINNKGARHFPRATKKET